MPRNGNSWEQILKHLKEDRPLTTFEVSKICGVVHSTVSNWVEAGKLPAYKTPGGHRRIRKNDLLLFLKLYQIPVPHELAPERILTHVSENSNKSFFPLPLEKGEQSLSIPPLEKGERGGLKNGKKKILIVEDDQEFAEILLETLKASYPNFEIHLAIDGFEAGKEIAQFLPDLIILDLILPGMDGFKVLRNLRQDARFSTTKILAISGFDTQENRERILQAGGVDGFIPKPLDLHNLRKQIEKLLAIKSR